MEQKYSNYKSSELLTFNEVPSHWNKSRIKHIGFMYGGLTGKSGDDFRKDEDDPSNKPFIPFTNICNNTYIKRDDLKLVSITEEDNQNRVEKDDIFFMMTSETQVDVGKTSVLKEDLGEVYLNTFCKGYRITDKSVNPYFLNYLLNGKPYREILSIQGNGFTRINLRQDRVNDFIIFIPPLPEQEQIVKYLDEKTSQIDNLISITEKKIELLKQKKTSLINEVVTKGLNRDVEMKDSGVEWIGEIPKHWEVRPLKYFSKIVLGKMLNPENKGNQILKPYLRSQNVQVENCDLSDIKEMWFSENELNEIRVMKDELLVNEGGDVGRTCIWKDEMDEVYIQNSINKVTIIEGLPRYYFFQFLSHHISGFFDSVVNRVSIPHLTKEKLSNVEFVSPTHPEQEQIVEYIDKYTTEIDNLVSIEQRRIDALKEYRQSLISEVVTGKIKVTKEESTIKKSKK